MTQSEKPRVKLRLHGPSCSSEVSDKSHEVAEVSEVWNTRPRKSEVSCMYNTSDFLGLGFAFQLTAYWPTFDATKKTSCWTEIGKSLWILFFKVAGRPCGNYWI